MIVKHKFFDHKINPNTRTLVIGTFNPATEENDANFFYSRQRNFLWTLIPNAFGKVSLKGASKDEKIKFMNEFNIDFVDLILEVNVEKADNYDDGYIDKKVEKWNQNINSEIDKLKHLEKVCFTRKTLGDIQKMKFKIELIIKHCESRNISFKFLTTPARFYNSKKQIEWTEFFSQN